MLSDQERHLARLGLDVDDRVRAHGVGLREEGEHLAVHAECLGAGSERLVHRGARQRERDLVAPVRQARV